MLLSVYIHSVSTCFQSNICKWNKLAKIQKKIWMYIHMIKTQTAHRQFQSFVVTYLFEFILSYFFHSESPLSFILCYMSAKFVRLCQIYRIGDTCFCCLCPCITTCFWYLILWSLKCEKENKNGKTFSFAFFGVKITSFILLLELLYIGETKLLFRMKSAIVVWMRSWSASKAHLHKASCSLILLSWWAHSRDGISYDLKKAKRPEQKNRIASTLLSQRVRLHKVFLW